MKKDFYNGYKLLQQNDADGNRPTFYIVCSNRLAGKSTFFIRYLFNQFIENNKKFILLYRFQTELIDCAEKCFKYVRDKWFRQYSVKDVPVGKIFRKIYIRYNPDGEDAWIECGYAVSITQSDSIKKMSNLFSDAEHIFFDEYVSETDHYAPREITKFLSIMMSVSRGIDEQFRYVPCYMVSNRIKTLNPYNVSMHITGKLNPNTNFVRGHGVVMEYYHSESAQTAMETSGLMRAFSGAAYVDKMTSKDDYLYSNDAFIEDMSGNSRYIMTIQFENEKFGLRNYVNDGIIYVSRKIEPSCRTIMSLTIDDHDANTILKNQFTLLLNPLRKYFEIGRFRFADETCKEMAIELLSY